MHDNLFARKRVTYWQAVQKLIGHAAGTAVLFVALAALSWLIGWAVGAMEATHSFNPGILDALHFAEVALLYLDFLISGIVITVSAARFLAEVLGARE